MDEVVGSKERVGLALSGGGIRAAAFHLGVLGFLADRGALEQVTHLSTVSGGSLVIAGVLSVNDMRWPSSAEFRSALPKLKALLTTRGLLSLGALGLSGIARYNYRILTDRASILADMLRRQWGVEAKLADLPDSPLWWINTTCIETGKNWRFSKREMGDWQFGRHYRPPFSIAEAVTASAGVPYAVGALKLDLPKAGWYETDPATSKPIKEKELELGVVRLWDGGAYENLGLEALFKAGRGLSDFDFLICSDASAPLQMAQQQNPILTLLQGRLASPRLFDISSDQIRALRSRMFVGALTRGEIRGALLRMGNSARSLDLRMGVTRMSEDYDKLLSDDAVAIAAGHPTDLQAMSAEIFDALTQHGGQVAGQILGAFAPGLGAQVGRTPAGTGGAR